MKVDGHLSESMAINTGVPQGSILGALLFILYINDIERVPEHCDLSLLADDTLLSITAETYQEAIIKINIDLQKIYRWLCMNKLKVNTQKTKWICFNASRHVNIALHNDININGEPIERVNSAKYLGIIIDEKLAFHEHFEHVIKKAAKKVGFFHRISHQLTNDSRRTIFNTIITPHFRYCSSILFLGTQENIQQLQIIQNRAMRILTRKNRFTPIMEMVEQLDILMIDEQIRFDTLVLIYKIRNNYTPEYLTRNLKSTREATIRNLRNANELRIPKRIKQIETNSIYFRGIILFNALPKEVKEANDISAFKIQLSQHLKHMRNSN